MALMMAQPKPCITSRVTCVCIQNFFSPTNSIKRLAISFADNRAGTRVSAIETSANLASFSHVTAQILTVQGHLLFADRVAHSHPVWADSKAADCHYFDFRQSQMP